MPGRGLFCGAGGDALILGIENGAGSPYYEQQAHAPQPFPNHFQHESSDQRHLTAATELVPPGVLAELRDVLHGLSDTKECRTAAATWFIKRASFGPALARAMLDHVLGLGHDVERQLDIVYVVGEILYDSLARRSRPSDLDPEALAFLPVLGTMLTAVFQNHQNPESYDLWVRMLLQEVYKVDDVAALEAMMVAQSAPSLSESSVGLHPPADSRDFNQVLKELEMEQKALESTLHHEGNGQTSSAIQTMLWAGQTAREMGKCISTFHKMTSDIMNLERLFKEKERMMVHMSNELQQARKQLYDVQNENAAREQSWTAERLAFKVDIEKHVEEVEELRKNLETEKRKSLCKICYVMPRDSITFPCSHFDYCFRCLEEHKKAQGEQSGSKTTNTCPTCRAQIRAFVNYGDSTS